MGFNYQDHVSGDYGETWEPDKGEVIVGKAIALRSADTKYGPKPVLEVQTSDGEKWSVWANRNLLDAMQEAGIDEGDRIAITFLGKEVIQGKKGDFVMKTFTAEKRAEGQPTARKPPADDLVGL